MTTQQTNAHTRHTLSTAVEGVTLTVTLLPLGHNTVNEVAILCFMHNIRVYTYTCVDYF